MKRLARQLSLAVLFLSALPVVGTELSGGSARPIVTADQSASVHYKNSAWPLLIPRHLASGNVASVKTQI